MRHPGSTGGYEASEGLTLTVGAIAMGAFVLSGGGVTAGWLAAQHGLFASVIAAVVLLVTIGLAHWPARSVARRAAGARGAGPRKTLSRSINSPARPTAAEGA